MTYAWRVFSAFVIGFYLIQFIGAIETKRLVLTIIVIGLLSSYFKKNISYGVTVTAFLLGLTLIASNHFGEPYFFSFINLIEDEKNINGSIILSLMITMPLYALIFGFKKIENIKS